MFKLKTIILISFVSLSLFINFSCLKKEPQKLMSKTIVVLVDYSESVKDARQDYADSFNKIFSTLTPGDHLFIWKITEKSEMETKPIIDESFPYPKNAANEFYQKQEDTRAKKIIEAKLIEIKRKIEYLLNFNEQLSRWTAIMGSLQVAESVFKTDKKDKSILVILSDMIEDSSEYNFENNTLTNKRVDEIIATQKNKNRLPDLNGVKVYIAGARATNREQFYNIRDFWLRYFKECGADLTKERYGSTLLNFNE